MLLSAVLQHLLFALALALLSAGVVRLMIAFPILDHPNARSSHLRPAARRGLGVVVAFIVGMLVRTAWRSSRASRSRNSSA